MYEWFPLLAILTGVVVVLAAPVVAVIAVAVERLADARVDRVAGILVAVPTTVAVGALLVLGGFLAASVVAAVVVVLAAAPLAVGWLVAAHADGLPGRTGRRWVVLAWPGCLALAGILFAAPGGFARYNVLFLDSPVRESALLALLAVAVLGPGIVVAVLDRRHRSRPVASPPERPRR
ncbi:hypothetical protein [Halorubellus salinus]|uniref:hypothetical protein n=1 Tax=Halorubellus salinus TaxID=755309 RepID=UPI001D081BA9|nr:hypothetical protein [Halorubellus salinus]